MAFNIDKLRKAHQFRFKTKILGELLCHIFSFSVMSEAVSLLPSLLERDIALGKNEERMLYEISVHQKNMTSQSSTQPPAARTPLSGASN